MRPVFHFFLLSAILLFASCIKPQGEFVVSEGGAFDLPAAREIPEGTSAGQVVQTLGSPFRVTPEKYVYAVQRERPVIRDFLVYSEPLIEEVTIQYFFLFGDGVVIDSKLETTTRYFPPNEKSTKPPKPSLR